MARARLRRASRIVAEVSIIVFSVFFALAANEWRQTQARNATVATVRATMRAEAETNRAQIERALEHHRDLIAQLQSGGIVLARLDLASERIDTTSAAALTHSLAAAARLRGAPIETKFRAERISPGIWRLRQGNDEFRLQIEGESALLRGIGNISLQPAFLIDSSWETAQITQAAVHMDPETIAALARARQLARLVEGTVSRLVDILYATTASGDILAALHDLAMFETNLRDAYDDLLARL